MNHDHRSEPGPSKARKVSRFVFFGFVAVAAYFLITEHRAHLFGILPFVLLAACPLMHMFHHGGHGEKSDQDSERKPPDSQTPPTPGTGTHQH